MYELPAVYGATAPSAYTLQFPYGDPGASRKRRPERAGANSAAAAVVSSGSALATPGHQGQAFGTRLDENGRPLGGPGSPADDAMGEMWKRAR
jgi:hypothetical protein